MLAAPWLFQAVAPLPSVHVDAGTGTLILAGLLVGIGTRYGSGCTSGHGVCGISRLSPRSLVATASFILAGFATVLVVRHLLPEDCHDSCFRCCPADFGIGLIVPG
jgi:uncharacterized membrane protein YedE/YeeE